MRQKRAVVLSIRLSIQTYIDGETNLIIFRLDFIIFTFTHVTSTQVAFEIRDPPFLRRSQIN